VPPEGPFVSRVIGRTDPCCDNSKNITISFPAAAHREA
jgi:hypothetical protein